MSGQSLENSVVSTPTPSRTVDVTPKGKQPGDDGGVPECQPPMTKNLEESGAGESDTDSIIWAASVQDDAERNAKRTDQKGKNK